MAAQNKRVDHAVAAVWCLREHYHLEATLGLWGRVSANWRFARLWQLELEDCVTFRGGLNEATRMLPCVRHIFYCTIQYAKAGGLT